MTARALPRLTGIDLAAPGGLEALFATCRARFGDAVMSADAGDAGGSNPDGGAGGGDQKAGDKDGPGKRPYQPPATQEEFERVMNARVAREREKFADYDALRAKAEQFDAAAEAAKTEQERAVDAARAEGASAAVRAANEKAATSILRAGLSARGVSAEDQATLLEAVNVAAFLTSDGADVDTDKVAAYATRVAGAPAGGGYDLGQGYRPKVGRGFGSAGREEAARRYPRPSTT